MERLIILALCTFIFACLAEPQSKSSETILSTVLTPDAKEKTLTRQGRSYYDPRFGPLPRPLYERPEYGRLEYDRPARCGRCYEDRYDDRDRDRDRDDRDSDRSRDSYDDDRRGGHKPTYGSRNDRNRNDNDDDDRRYSTDRSSNSNNGTDNENDGDNKKRPHDDRDDRDRPSGGRHRNRNRDRDRDRYDDRDRYRPDYYDRFLTRDPYGPSYDRQRPYYEDPYRERRPLYDRYDDGGFGGRYDGYGYPGYQRPSRPAYDDRYNRGTGYDDAYGGYGPGVGRGSHDSFRPWDETYRGQAGWDAGGRGYYFASGRPEPAPAVPAAPAAPAWGRPAYPSRPAAESGWQNAGGGYAGGYRDYRDPIDYRGSLGYGQQEGGYRQDVSAVYGQPGYAQSGFGQGSYGQNTAAAYGQGSYGQNTAAAYGQGGYGQGGYGQGGDYQGGYGQGGSGQGYDQGGYGGQTAGRWHSVGERIRPYRDQSGVTQPDRNNLDQNRDRYPSRDRERERDRERYPGNRQPAAIYGTTFGQTYQSTGTYSSSSTTPQTSYLHQREDQQVTAEDTTKAS